MFIFSERLKTLRNEANKTQAEMAIFFNCTIQHYQRIEYGKIDLPTSKLVALADYFDVSTDYLLGRSDDSEPLSYRSEFQKDFSERLGALIDTFDSDDLEAAGLSREELYYFADIKHKHSFGKICELADRLGISLDYLCGRSEEQ
jgi:transcriptional regulator with XRE-family HTH domain